MLIKRAITIALATTALVAVTAGCPTAEPDPRAPAAEVCPLGTRQITSTSHREAGRYSVLAGHVICDPADRLGPFKNEVVKPGRSYWISSFKDPVDVGAPVGKVLPAGVGDCRCTSGDCSRPRDFGGPDCAGSSFPLPGVPRFGLIYRLERETGFRYAGDGALQGYRVLLPEGQPTAICFQVNDERLEDNAGAWTVTLEEEVVETRCDPVVGPPRDRARTCDEESCVTASCTSDRQCCTKSCSGGRCATCVAPFGLCTSNANCCSCSCVQGHCR
jgi:hypothetical protein